MFHPGPHPARIFTIAAIVATMFTVATNKTAADSITTISSPSRSAVPHMLGPPTSTCTFTATRNCSGADEIILDDANHGASGVSKTLKPRHATATTETPRLKSGAVGSVVNARKVPRLLIPV